MADLQAMLKQIKEMSVMELNELVKLLETEFGVSAAAVSAAPAAGAAAAAPVVEEQTEFAVVLKEIGPNKINVIKAVREITGLGLGEAKALVDGAPSTIKEGLNKTAAQEAQAKFKDAGAVCELK
ncbi:MAG: 50S ribosomal protein L7/L12 [Clostridiales bacterium]|jgi:large subunit ribosomal protein L7/L12|nr:50S ribosomal protein L7/L12 [Clostridiales bacterium]